MADQFVVSLLQDRSATRFYSHYEIMIHDYHSHYFISTGSGVREGISEARGANDMTIYAFYFHKVEAKKSPFMQTRDELSYIDISDHSEVYIVTHCDTIL